MSLNLSIPIERYWDALADTLTMVGVSGGIAFAAGVPLAVLLIVTAPGGFLASPRLHRAVGSVVSRRSGRKARRQGTTFQASPL